ncbi:MAG: phosphopyruvate hydratase [Thermoleophilia bacterium]|nr:phosphopyruvate hydratase [Thermoleophilia bacterium]
MSSSTIRRVHARQVLDSRGNPTVEVDVELEGGARGRAAVPSGASTGTHEAVELRDGGTAWAGKGVGKAVANVDGEISAALVGTDATDHAAVDRTMIELDGTPNKGRLGANAILGVSLALARALAAQSGLEVWEWLREAYGITDPAVLPVPMLNVINGGEHANNAIDVQEFMVVPHGFDTFSEGLQAAVRVFHQLKKDIDARGLSTAVGDEGGFAPDLGSNVEALDLLVEAIGRAGYDAGTQVSIALDAAATEFFKGGRYEMAGDGTSLDAEGIVAMYESWMERAPIVSIEDGTAEDDWDGWRLATDRLGAKIQVVGDDVFVTNPERLQRGIDAGVANSMLVKVNQIGSLSETIAAMRLGQAAGYTNVMSHRSGETEDPIIADLAVGTGCGQIKTGAPSRSDRVAKYNQLLRIEEQLGDRAVYARPFDRAVAGAGR